MAARVTPASEEIAIICLAAGELIRDAASASGISERTLFRKQKTDAFQTRIRAAKEAFTRRALDRLLSLRLKHVQNIDRLAGADPLPPVSSAQERALAIAALESGTVRLNASKAILEIGSRLVAEHEFDERLRALEARSAAGALPPPPPPADDEDVPPPPDEMPPAAGGAA